MGKYKINREELKMHWNDQLDFIRKSIKAFDSGDEKEARRLAICLRVLLHQTTKSDSLIRQRNLTNNFYFWSSSGLYIPTNELSTWSLLNLSTTNEGVYYTAKGHSDEIKVFMKYIDWWNEIIFDDKENVFTRRDIVGYVANQDGGAHVGKFLDSNYAALIKHNSLGWKDQYGNPAKNNAAYSAIRQIAEELLISDYYFDKGKYTRGKIKNREFVITFVDSYRRYKYPYQDSILVEKLFSSKREVKREKRSCYLHTFEDGLKIGVLL